jgi:hypothetical protein
VPLVAARGGKVILEVQPGLHRVLEGIPGVATCIRQGEPIPEFRYHCPLLSLPYVFGTTTETIPAANGYLEYLQAFGDRPGRRDRLKVGLAWAGNPGHQRDRLRSLSLEHFAPLAGVDGVHFVSLQKGEAALQAAEPLQATKQRFPFDATEERVARGDFADTAAVIAEMDLVITVDTSVAHLAGAMGKPVWILLSKLPDWRWGVHRETTPWYASARLFRQTECCAWEELLQQVTAELKLLIADFPPRLLRATRRAMRRPVQNV